jgi:hypothetical protein
MNNKIATHAVPFVKELISIVSGILIALFIDNWNDQRKDKEYLTQAFASINNELKENASGIKKIVATQTSLLDTLDIYINDNKVSILDISAKAKGLKMGSIKLNAWKAVSNSKIELVEYDKISTLENIESTKEELRTKAEAISNFLYSNMFSTTREDKLIYKIILSDIIYSENSALSEIEKYQKKYRNKYKL